MKQPITAVTTITIKGTLEYCAEEAITEKANGYAVEKVKVKRCWPFFWRRRYTVKMRKHFLIDEYGITQVPSTIEIKNWFEV